MNGFILLLNSMSTIKIIALLVLIAVTMGLKLLLLYLDS